MKRYQERAPGDESCSSPKCRQTFEIRYLTGATELNPGRDVQLCERHHLEWCDTLEATRSQLHEASEPAAPCSPDVTSTLFEGLNP